MILIIASTFVLNYPANSFAPTPKEQISQGAIRNLDKLSTMPQLIIKDMIGDKTLPGKPMDQVIKKMQEKGKTFRGFTDGLVDNVAKRQVIPVDTAEPQILSSNNTVTPKATSTQTISPRTGAVTGPFSVKPVGVLSGTSASISENEPSIAYNPMNPNQIAIASHTSGLDWSGFECVVYRSSDGGVTWLGPVQLIPLVAGDTCSDPVLSWSADGTVLHAAYMSIGFTNAIVDSRSTNGGASFTTPKVIFQSTVVAGDFMDKPWIAADKDTTAPGFVYATTTQFLPTGCAILFSRSSNYGATWTAPVTLDSANCGDRVVQGSSVSADAGMLVVGWYDSTSDGWLDGTFKINTVRSTNRGASFAAVNTPFAVDAYSELPYSMCPDASFERFWGTMFPRIDVRNIAGTNQVGIVFGADTQGAGQPDCSDVYLARSTNQGATYTITKISGSNDNAEFFPDVAIQDDGTFHMMYMSTEDVSILWPGGKVTYSIYPWLTGPFEGNPVDNMSYRIKYRAMLSDGSLSSESTPVTRYSLSDYAFLGDYNDLSVTPQGTVYYAYTDRRDHSSGDFLTQVFDPEDDVYFVKG